jgi:tetratricopeptide (TPR) repeat protein
MSCEIALNYFEKCIEDYKKFPNSVGGNANISISYYNRGECLLNLGRINEAENSFLESIEFAKKADATSAIAFAQKGLAKVYTFQEQYTKAIELLSIALQNSEKVGDKVLNRALYNALSINYLATEDLKNYFLYKNKNIAVHKEVTKAERKTVDDSINALMEVNSKKFETIQDRIKIVQIVSSLLIISGLILMIRHIFLSEKILNTLKKRLQI